MCKMCVAQSNGWMYTFLTATNRRPPPPPTTHHMTTTSDRSFHLEQDSGYLPEQCPVTRKWSNTRRVLLPSWTVYEYVGSPSYQTPVFCGTPKECETFIKSPN